MTNNEPTPAMAKKAWRKIMNLLKQEGPMDAQSLATHLNTSGMAVRQHLYSLNKEGIIDYIEQARDMGRPAKMWKLTSEANRFFPEGYADLTLSLINSMTDAFGEDAMERLLEIRTREQLHNYRQHIPENGSLHEKLKALAKIRTDEGYMAEVQISKDKENAFLFIEKHCPICVAATACAGFCSKELELFQRVLGEETEIKRIKHMIAGDQRCVYQVK